MVAKFHPPRTTKKNLNKKPKPNPQIPKKTPKIHKRENIQLPMPGTECQSHMGVCAQGCQLQNSELDSKIIQGREHIQEG